MRHQIEEETISGVMCATRKGYSVLREGQDFAGTRAIPLFLPRTDFEKAMQVLEEGPLFQILPLRKAKVGILVTGTEVFRGLVQDRFIPIIRGKTEKSTAQSVSRNSGDKLLDS